MLAYYSMHIEYSRRVSPEISRLFVYLFLFFCELKGKLRRD